MADDTLFDMAEVEKENEDKDPLDIKQRLFLNYYIENLAQNVLGAKVRAYCRAYHESTPEESPHQYHGARVSAVAQWRTIERKLGFQKLAHEMSLDNWTLLNKLKSLMEVQRPMMQKTADGTQEPVWYADGPVQLKATETIIRLANELSVEDRAKDVPTLNVRFHGTEGVSDWSNVEVNIEKKPEDLI